MASNTTTVDIASCDEAPGLYMLSPTEWGLTKYTEFDMEPALKLMYTCWPVIFSIIAGYLTMIFFVKPLRHSYWGLLKNVRQMWNMGLAIYSLLGAMHIGGHFAYSIATRGLYITLVQYDPTVMKGPTGFWLLLFVLGKIAELGDTVLLLLSGRTVSFLHGFHHSTVLPWCWYDLQAKTPIAFTCMCFNYAVHAVMYTYFALNDTFDDPAFRRRWGYRITGMQCTQFVLDLGVIATAAYDRIVNGPRDTSIFSLCLSTFTITSYLILFLRFAEEKYGFYSQFRHYLWKKRSGQSDTESSVMPWHRADLSLDKRYDEATKMAVMLSYVAEPMDLLTLYGCYKRVRDGPMPELEKEPIGADEKTRAKWRAWNSAKNLSKDEAMVKYIEMLDVLSERSEKAQAEKDRKIAMSRRVATDAATTDPFILYPIKIAGHGRYLPKRVVYNQEIEKRGGFTMSSLEQSRTGVTERRWVDINGGESLPENAAKAIRRACADAGIELEELDMIVGGFGGHQFLPDDACFVQKELGLGESGIRSFTVHATCLSFVVALDVAGAFMRDGRYRNVAVFASSIASQGLEANNPHTAGLFGDGAAAVILQSSDDSSAVHRVHVETYSEGVHCCRLEGGGTFRTPRNPLHTDDMDYFQMDGEETVSLISKYIRGVMLRALPGLQKGLTELEVPGTDKIVNVDWVIPHQASALGIDSLGMFGWPKEKILRTLHKYGNTIAASIPLTLCDHIDNGTIKRGDKILLCGTSAGLSCGAMLLTY